MKETMSCSFKQLDIKEFYPSINEVTINNAPDLVKQYINILNEFVNIKHHRKKSIIYYDNKIYAKERSTNIDDTNTNIDDTFDETNGKL